MLRDSDGAVELGTHLRLRAIEADRSDAHGERHAIVCERARDPEAEELARAIEEGAFTSATDDATVHPVGADRAEPRDRG